MSLNIYYSIRKNKKQTYWYNSLFFGKQKINDYKKIVNEIFDSYDECLNYILNNDLKNCHIRKTISNSSGVYHKDYYKGNKFYDKIN